MSTPLSHPSTRTGSRFASRSSRSPWTAVERARLTVVPRARTRAARVPFLTLISLVLVAGIAGLLLFNTHLQQASFAATTLEQRAAVLAGKEESLRMQVHRLRDPQHVATRAKALGMVPATSPAFLRLSDGKILGEPAPAAPEDTVRLLPLPPAKPSSVKPKLVILEVDKPKRKNRPAALAPRASTDRPADARRQDPDRADDAGTGAGRRG